MPQYNGKEVLTIGKAERAKRVAEKWFDDKGYLDAPAMYKPGHETDMWVLSLEGCGEWVTDISNDESVKWPAGVRVEPVNNYCLALIPQRDPGVDSEAGQLVRDWERAIAQGGPSDEHAAGIALAQFVRDKHLS